MLSKTFILLACFLASASAFPQLGTLSSVSERDVRFVSQHAARTFQRTPGPQPIPGPLNDTSSKLVNDEADHPWMPLRKGDQRGPCPGLNTLASHGYLDRSGIVTPAEIIDAVQIGISHGGFNMGWDLAVLVTYVAFLGNGNLLTNLISIGGKSTNTGADYAPVPPAIIGGLSTHGTFEGMFSDVSLTRGDAYFGDNHSFNETLFKQLTDTAIAVSNGTITLASQAEFRWARIQDSLARNPEFDFTTPRYITAYAEATFLPAFFSNVTTGKLSIEDATSFFVHNRFPDNFHKREGPFGLKEIGEAIRAVATPHPIAPEKNQGVGNYVVDTTDPGFQGNFACFVYAKAIKMVKQLYPNADGALLAALRGNLRLLKEAVNDDRCEEVFPYGKA